MFERFTDRARHAVVFAQEEARQLSHNYIGTEHLLLGLLRENEGVAAQALHAVGIDIDRARTEVEDRVGQGTVKPRGHVPFTPRAKNVLEFGLREALQLGHNYVGTEHILLGLIREGEGMAAQVLMTTVEGGLTHLRKEVIRILQGLGVKTATPGVTINVPAPALPQRLAELIREMQAKRRVSKSDLERLTLVIGEEVSAGQPQGASQDALDKVVVRLQAIEARLSEIERLLRKDGGNEEEVS